MNSLQRFLVANWLRSCTKMQQKTSKVRTLESCDSTSLQSKTKDRNGRMFKDNAMISFEISL